MITDKDTGKTIDIRCQDIKSRYILKMYKQLKRSQEPSQSITRLSSGIKLNS